MQLKRFNMEWTQSLPKQFDKTPVAQFAFSSKRVAFDFQWILVFELKSPGKQFTRLSQHMAVWHCYKAQLEENIITVLPLQGLQQYFRFSLILWVFLSVPPDRILNSASGMSKSSAVFTCWCEITLTPILTWIARKHKVLVGVTWSEVTV